jgi:hypothetical protein
MPAWPGTVPVGRPVFGSWPGRATGAAGSAPARRRSAGLRLLRLRVGHDVRGERLDHQVGQVLAVAAALDDLGGGPQVRARVHALRGHRAERGQQPAQALLDRVGRLLDVHRALHGLVVDRERHVPAHRGPVDQTVATEL